MAAVSSLSISSGGLSFCVLHSSLSSHHSASALKWGFRRDQDIYLVTQRSKGQSFQVLANTNVSPSKGRSKKKVIMVDPLEAKRLAAKQMEAIKAKEKLEKRREIEAINGAWAMIGLTAGLVIEGQTGNSILSQLVGYWEAIVHFFVR